MNSVCLAYSAVHQIFQLALAAHEIGELDGLLCTMVDHPGKWGRKLARITSVKSASPLGFDQIPTERMHEFPWPVVIHRTLMRLFPLRKTDHLRSNGWFDNHAAKWVRDRDARIFVGGETCALRSLTAAKERGMTAVLDCPGIPSTFLDRAARRAAEDCGLPPPPASNGPVMHERKLREMEIADVILACSEMQKATMTAEGLARPEKIRAISLWTDVDYWSSNQGVSPRVRGGGKLKVLFAGAISLKKGVPYLLRAMREIGDAAELTLVGGISHELVRMLGQHQRHTHIPYASRGKLRDLYRSHDVLVMPTLGDSFGFVVLEAMAAGLPVITTTHGGAPVPDESWRVPACDSAAIEQRLRHYVADRSALERDSRIAREFATQYRPERYRREVATLFQELMSQRADGRLG